MRSVQFDCPGIVKLPGHNKLERLISWDWWLAFILTILAHFLNKSFQNLQYCKCHMSRSMTKPTMWPVHPAKTQISLGIHPVWSESSLSAWRNLWSLATHWVHSKDSDQTGWMPRLIWVFVGHIWHFVGFVMPWLNYQVIGCYSGHPYVIEMRKKYMQKTQNHDKYVCYRTIYTHPSNFYKLTKTFSIINRDIFISWGLNHWRCIQNT